MKIGFKEALGKRVQLDNWLTTLTCSSIYTILYIYILDIIFHF